MLEIGGHKLYNVEELTEKLDVTKLTIRTYIKQGRLSARKIGGKWYVTEEELISFLSLTDRSKGAQA